MTLFPSALRSDRPRVMGTSLRPRLGLRNFITRVLVHRRHLTPVLSVVTPHEDAAHPDRAEPQLQWTDPWTAPGGDFSSTAIPGAELDETAVPRRGESWEAVSDFALSYDGYGYWDDLPTLAGRVLQRWTRRRSLPTTLDELRGCLFYEQRRWHHFGEDPSGRSAEYMWALIEAIGALAAPYTPAPAPIADPRRATAPEAHVKLVPAPSVNLRSLPSSTPTLRPLPARPRLVPVPASEAHVRLVSAIEGEAGAVARHPSGHALRQSWSHAGSPGAGSPAVSNSAAGNPAAGNPAAGNPAAGDPAQHPSTARSVRDLRPMPSAEPLPKPPVIVRRARRTASASTNRPGGALHTAQASEDRWSTNKTRWDFEKVTGAAPSATDVTPLCREFFEDDTQYHTWIDAHPRGFVLNQPRSSRAKGPTLHRVGCGAVTWRVADETNPSEAVRVCGPSAEALRTWSLARGTAEPTACRRCCPTT